MDGLLRSIGVRLPIVQAPMAGVSTPEMAAAVTNAGGLGSIAIGAMSVASARTALSSVRQLTSGPFNVNVFCHVPARADSQREAAWLATLRPVFNRFGAEPPASLQEIYTSFVADDEMLQLLIDFKPAVVSFHFGLPPQWKIDALKSNGIKLFASVTSLTEAEHAAAAKIDALVGQGYEAGGHRGMFAPTATDDQLGTLALTRLLVTHSRLPVIAAGGIMDGAGVAAARALGAEAAQLGTAFIACAESSADQHYRNALFSQSAAHTEMTIIVSGRPARCLRNEFTTLRSALEGAAVPDYPIAYDAGKALNAAAKAHGEGGFGAQWAGQAAPLARSLPASELVAALEAEMVAAVARLQR